MGDHPDSKGHGANMGPTWGRQDPGGPHVGPVNLVALWVASSTYDDIFAYMAYMVMTVLFLNRYNAVSNVIIFVIYDLFHVSQMQLAYERMIRGGAGKTNQLSHDLLHQY